MAKRLPTLKALTIQNPWAAAVVRGLKVEEYRSWGTSHRGIVLVHAGKSRASMGEADQFPTLTAADYAFGALVGACRVVGCEACGEGGFAWRLADAVAFAGPLPWIGNVGLWDCEVTGPLRA